MKTSTSKVHKALRLAAVCALLALVMMVWGVIVPSPISLVIAMSVGQALGTLSFAVFCAVVLLDLRKSGVFSDRARRFSSTPPDPPAQ
jgi:hypothetical protein